MKRVDLHLDKPINILGKGGTSYPNTIHIDTTSVGDEYIEDTSGEILFLHEMDEVMRENVCSVVEQNI